MPIGNTFIPLHLPQVNICMLYLPISKDCHSVDPRGQRSPVVSKTCCRGDVVCDALHHHMGVGNPLSGLVHHKAFHSSVGLRKVISTTTVNPLIEKHWQSHLNHDIDYYLWDWKGLQEQNQIDFVVVWRLRLYKIFSLSVDLMSVKKNLHCALLTESLKFCIETEFWCIYVVEVWCHFLRSHWYFLSNFPDNGPLVQANSFAALPRAASIKHM